MRAVIFLANRGAEIMDWALLGSTILVNYSKKQANFINTFDTL